MCLDQQASEKINNLSAWKWAESWLPWCTKWYRGQRLWKLFLQERSLRGERIFHRKWILKIAFHKDGILSYKGRILPKQNVKAVREMSAIMKDLSLFNFCVSVICKHSPLEYSLNNEIQWHSHASKHSVVENVWKYVLKFGYIMQGRDLVKKIKTDCERYRCLRKQSTLKWIQFQYTIQKCQVDLCGKCKTYSPHNKRTTINCPLLSISACLLQSSVSKSRKTAVQRHLYNHLLNSLVKVTIQRWH